MLIYLKYAHSTLQRSGSHRCELFPQTRLLRVRREIKPVRTKERQIDRYLTRVIREKREKESESRRGCIHEGTSYSRARAREDNIEVEDKPPRAFHLHRGAGAGVPAGAFLP